MMSHKHHPTVGKSVRECSHLHDVSLMKNHTLLHMFSCHSNKTMLVDPSMLLSFCEKIAVGFPFWINMILFVESSC